MTYSWCRTILKGWTLCLLHRKADPVQAAALCHLLKDVLLQVPDDGWDAWMIHVLKPKHAVEAKYFCAVAVYWRPTWIINFLLRLRQSRPDEPLSIEISARFHSNLAAFLKRWLTFSFKMNVTRWCSFSGLKLELVNPAMWMFHTITFRSQGCLKLKCQTPTSTPTHPTPTETTLNLTSPYPTPLLKPMNP